MTRSRSPGADRMRALALDLPQQLLDGYRHGRELGVAPRTIRNATVTAMGGSAIAADLAANLTDPETELALTVSRGPDLPRYVGRDCLGIFASYSGDTWETLRAYEEGQRRGGPMAVIASGGELARRADRDGVPHLPLPPGLPPRAAVGYLLGGLLGILDPFFPESNDRRLEAAADSLREHGPVWADPGGAAATCGRELHHRLPSVYTSTGFSGLARRWKNQLEENAKILASFDIVPELFHNALVGWDALPKGSGRERAVVSLEWTGASASERWSFDYLAGVLRERRVAHGRVPLVPEDRLAALLHGVAFGDHVSLFLADARRVDPLPIGAIIALKQAQAASKLLGPPARPARARPKKGAK